MHPLPDLIAQATTQHGIVTREQVARFGATRHQIARLVTSGALVRVGSSSYRLAGGMLQPKQRLLAACLEVRGVAWNRSAAALHGIGGWTLGPGRPTVLVLRGNGVIRSPLAQVCTTTWLPSDDIVVVDKIPCASVARTLIGLAAPKHRLTTDRLRDLVDVAIREGKASDDWLWWRLEQLRRSGRPGIRAMEQVLADRASMGPTESWLERGLLRVCTTNGLPLPRCQARVAPRGRFAARVDFIYDHAPVIIEVLGHAYHSTREQLMADAARRNALQLAGFRVYEFTYDDIVRNPRKVARTIAEALGLPLI